jgi:parvulin-like peptidyl-prolyl isomerase
MAKTPMQELIERLKELSEAYKKEADQNFWLGAVSTASNLYRKHEAYLDCMFKATELLKREEEVIIDSFDKGRREQSKYPESINDGLEYFNQTFGGS